MNFDIDTYTYTIPTLLMFLITAYYCIKNMIYCKQKKEQHLKEKLVGMPNYDYWWTFYIFFFIMSFIPVINIILLILFCFFMMGRFIINS